MTTTDTLQTRPDYYSTMEECLEDSKNQVQTNPRYKNFKQAVFTAGDESQFQFYRDTSNEYLCVPEISLTKNLFVNQPFRDWEKYKDLKADAVINTFRYIFHKFKKGIFVKIADNKLRVFLPFSKSSYLNEWGDRIKVDNNKYGTVKDFIRKISEGEGRRFNPRYVNDNTSQWYGNNCLVRYEYPLSEGETNVTNVKNMLEELCAKRQIPDIEFFVNRRDFPILTRDGTEPYNNIWDSEKKPLVSHNYPQYAPILSMSITSRYADVLMPTWEDWIRVQSYEDKWFPKSCRTYKESFTTPWSEKKSTAVFRGGTTGCGVTIDTNMRLKLAYLSKTTKPDQNGVPYLDAGITNWNLRPRKIQGQKYLQTIEKDSLPFQLVNRLSPLEQSKYKYVVNVDGHVTAYRLSLELSMGVVILLAESDWKVWYSDMLVPYEHYVPVKKDLSDLIEKIKWCRKNDEKCRMIAQNALTFFNTFLQKNGVLDYMQKILVDLKDEVGVYLYNTSIPLDSIVQYEFENIDLSFPSSELTESTASELVDMSLSSPPKMTRCYGLLRGIELFIRKIIATNDFESHIVYSDTLFTNKSSSVRLAKMAFDMGLVVKTTSDHQKLFENIHETYIATKSLNELSKVTPNFSYVFGMYKNNDEFNVVSEYINGETLYDYIKSPKFDFGEFLMILSQLCLALQVAQNTCQFVHYDLTPWNIMLQRTEKPMTFDYAVNYDKIVRVNTSVIPIIIDYGKSYVIHDHMHHGFVNMFNFRSVQDVLHLLTVSTHEILTHQKLPPKDFSGLIKLANFISGTKYRPELFQTAKSMREFMAKTKNYSSILNSDKYELENFTPYDLLKYIMKMKAEYNFPISITKKYSNVLNDGNGLQVFDYMSSSTVVQKIDSYINVCARLKQSTIPQPDNLFFVYYAAQTIQTNLRSVRESMVAFLKAENIDATPHVKIFDETIDFIHNLYMSKISSMKMTNVDYSLKKGTFTMLKYDETTFLLPEKILGMLTQQLSPTQTSENNNLNENVSTIDTTDVIESVFLYEGMYSMSSEHREFYMKNFKELLDFTSSGKTTKTMVADANIHTLYFISKDIYSKDLEDLPNLVPKNIVKEKCKPYVKYNKVYTSLLESITKKNLNSIVKFKEKTPDAKQLNKEMTKSTPVFVYGTLLSELHNNYHMKNATFIGVGRTVDNFKLYVTDSIIPKAVPGGNSPTIGEVYDVPNDVMAAIDDVEYKYNKIQSDIILASGEKVRTYMYIFNKLDDTQKNEYIPHGDYKKYLKDENYM